MSGMFRDRPRPVLLAAAMFVVYGVAVVVNAVHAQGWTGWVEAGSLPRALLRLAAAMLIAWGLLLGAVWAWWLGLALAILWLASGLMPVLVTDGGDLRWLQPSGDQIFLVVSLLSLGLAVALLLTPSVRGFLRRS